MSTDKGAARDAAPFRVDMVEVPPGLPIEICPFCQERVCRVPRRLVGHAQSLALVSIVEPFEFPTTRMPLHPCLGALEKLTGSDRRPIPAPAYDDDEPDDDAPVAELCPAFSPQGRDDMKTAKPTPRAAHHCAIPGCSKSVPEPMLMCSAHWFKVPKLLRDEVWRLYERKQLRRGDESAKGEHRRACAAAVRAVQEAMKDG